MPPISPLSPIHTLTSGGGADVAASVALGEATAGGDRAASACGEKKEKTLRAREDTETTNHTGDPHAVSLSPTGDMLTVSAAAAADMLAERGSSSMEACASGAYKKTHATCAARGWGECACAPGRDPDHCVFSSLSYSIMSAPLSSFLRPARLAGARRFGLTPTTRRAGAVHVVRAGEKFQGRRHRESVLAFFARALRLGKARHAPHACRRLRPLHPSVCVNGRRPLTLACTTLRVALC